MSLRYKDSSQREVIYADGHKKYRVMAVETALRESGLRSDVFNLLKEPLEVYLAQQAERHIRSGLIGSVHEGGCDESSDIDILLGLNLRKKKELKVWNDLLNLNNKDPDHLLGINHAPYELHFHVNNN